MSLVKKVIQFIQTDIWRIRLQNHSRSRSFLIKLLRVVVLSFRGFDEDKCRLRASALTLYSLLSIVPVIAMIFGIAKGFGLEARVENMIMERLEGQEEMAEEVINFSQSLLDNAKGGLIAGIGVAILFWSIIKVLGNIENSFNHIWGIKKARTLGRKFSDYLSFILVCPILLVISSSITVVISSQIAAVTEKMAALEMVASFILFLLKFTPYVVIWILFTFIYFFMPNTRVRIRAALIAGFVAGTAFQLVQWVYVTFQIGVAKYGAIYGSFAALPLFLIWMQLSWIVVLFGAEISFAYQNVDTYEFEPDCLNVSHSFKNLLALLMSHLLVKNFCQGEKAWDATQISHKLDMPIRLVRQILYELVAAGVVSEVLQEDKAVAYQPARDVDGMTVTYVIRALEDHGNTSLPVMESDEKTRLSECLENFGKEIECSPGNILLKEL